MWTVLFQIHLHHTCHSLLHCCSELVHADLALNYPEALRVDCIRDLLLACSSRSFISVESCQCSHPSHMDFTVILISRSLDLFLFKFPLEVRFKETERAESVYLAPHTTQSSLPMFHACFSSVRKKRSAFYKNPARAG